MTINKACNDDLIVWPDGTQCYADELEEYLSFMGDDFETIPHGTDRYNATVDK